MLDANAIQSTYVDGSNEPLLAFADTSHVKLFCVNCDPQLRVGTFHLASGSGGPTEDGTVSQRAAIAPHVRQRSLNFYKNKVSRIWCWASAK